MVDFIFLFQVLQSFLEKTGDEVSAWVLEDGGSWQWQATHKPRLVWL